MDRRVRLLAQGFDHQLGRFRIGAGCKAATAHVPADQMGQHGALVADKQDETTPAETERQHGNAYPPTPEKLL
jgi:hypothetical protein